MSKTKDAGYNLQKAAAVRMSAANKEEWKAAKSDLLSAAALLQARGERLGKARLRVQKGPSVRDF